jgi:hypothetical protein
MVAAPFKKNREIYVSLSFWLERLSARKFTKRIFSLALSEPCAEKRRERRDSIIEASLVEAKCGAIPARFETSKHLDEKGVKEK